MATYLALAAVFEFNRTSSPHRLLVANGALSILGFALILMAILWRVHYVKKRLEWRREGRDVEVL
ncbi:hypothetical protein BOO71_0002311 [Deinococcus marmoris]|uniref:Uncharacterized protein n=2 Tax=Deinococcus marmoris TaxID=249408 RepID=A0A1U7P2Y8_9DEIO|nr:hypothetical protein BOO71_0002311 [Deinococcus marmoris]